MYFSLLSYYSILYICCQVFLHDYFIITVIKFQPTAALRPCLLISFGRCRGCGVRSPALYVLVFSDGSRDMLKACLCGAINLLISFVQAQPVRSCEVCSVKGTWNNSVAVMPRKSLYRADSLGGSSPLPFGFCLFLPPHLCHVGGQDVVSQEQPTRPTVGQSLENTGGGQMKKIFKRMSGKRENSSQEENLKTGTGKKAQISPNKAT